jgi:hypothetical protein
MIYINNNKENTSPAFNCSHDTESEYIWLWFMGSYLYSSIWYFKKWPPTNIVQPCGTSNNTSWNIWESSTLLIECLLVSSLLVCQSTLCLHLPQWYQQLSTVRMILSQNIYGYGSWVVIFIVIFAISKNAPLLVPYTCILKSIRARLKQLILKWELD